jgi:hypothetical protein
MRSCAPCKSPPARDHSSFGSSVRRPQLSLPVPALPPSVATGGAAVTSDRFDWVPRRLLWQAAFIIWT